MFKEESLNKKITILNKEPIPVPLAKDLYLTALKENKLALIETGSIARIIPELSAQKKVNFTPNNHLAPNSSFALTSYRLKHIAVNEVYFAMSLHLRGIGRAYRMGNNTLVLSGPSGTLRTLVEILNKLDRKNSLKLYSISLVNHPAAEALDLIQKLGVVSYRDAKKIFLADMNNSLMLYGTKKFYQKVAKALKDMDHSEGKMSAKQKSSFYVRPLEFAPAAEIAKILNQVKRKINPPGFFSSYSLKKMTYQRAIIPLLLMK